METPTTTPLITSLEASFQKAVEERDKAAQAAQTYASESQRLNGVAQGLALAIDEAKREAGIPVETAAPEAEVKQAELTVVK